MNSQSDVDWLESWYQLWCDGDWEHQYGIQIRTRNEPRGWILEVDLADTQFEDCVWDGAETFRTEYDWIKYRAEALKFHAEGGEWNLSEMIAAFRLWAQGVHPARRNESPTRFIDLASSEEQPVTSGFQCIETAFRQEEIGLTQLTVETLDNPGWALNAEFLLPACIEDRIALARGWIEWSAKERRFQGFAGPRNLDELLGTFQSWLRNRVPPPAR